MHERLNQSSCHLGWKVRWGGRGPRNSVLVGRAHCKYNLTIVCDSYVWVCGPFPNYFTMQLCYCIVEHTVLSCCLWRGVDRGLTARGVDEDHFMSSVATEPGLDSFWMGVNSPCIGAHVKYLHSHTCSFTSHISSLPGLTSHSLSLYANLSEQYWIRTYDRIPLQVSNQHNPRYSPLLL